MVELEPTLSETIDRVTENGHGREPAICELRCMNCGDGMKYDMSACATCGGAVCFHYHGSSAVRKNGAERNSMESTVLEMPRPEIDELVLISRDAAICELNCPNCGDGMKFDQFRCATCGQDNPRYRA